LAELASTKASDIGLTTFRMGDEGTTGIFSKAKRQTDMGGERGTMTGFGNDSTPLQLLRVGGWIESDPIGVHATTRKEGQ
jgi:hypothetical protein